MSYAVLIAISVVLVADLDSMFRRCRNRVTFPGGFGFRNFGLESRKYTHCKLFEWWVYGLG